MPTLRHFVPSQGTTFLCRSGISDRSNITRPAPAADWRNATIDALVPALDKADRLLTSLGSALQLTFSRGSAVLSGSTCDVRPEKTILPREIAVPHPAAQRTVSGTSAVEVIGRAVVDATRRFRTSASAIYLCEQQREQLNVFFNSEDPSAGNLQPDDWLFVREVAACAEPMVVPNLADHPLFASRFPVNAQIAGLVGVPIFLSTQRLAGALCLISRQPLLLGATDIDELATYAVALGREIEAALPAAVPGGEEATDDAQTFEQQAITDSLTGLFNRRGTEKSVANEVARARRLGTSVSCILLDIDHFKTVNDTRGHLVGDQVLREISRLLKKTVRAYDTIGRWGGDEFLMLLPGVPLEQAQRLAERVCATVGARKIDGAGAVTVSAGVATLGSDYNFDGTFHAADQRLYKAKQSGRNRSI